MSAGSCTEKSLVTADAPVGGKVVDWSVYRVNFMKCRLLRSADRWRWAKYELLLVRKCLNSHRQS